MSAEEDTGPEAGSEAEPEESPGGEPKGKPEAKGPRDAWDKLQALSPLITGLVLALVGYFLTGSVNQAIQKSQLQFNYVKEMRELLAKMGDAKTTLDEAKTTAVALASFGAYAIPPLLNEIQSGEMNRPAAAEIGLRTVALADPQRACPALARILENRTAAYNWFTHRAAIRILGNANCQDAQSGLLQYQARVNAAASSDSGFKALQATIAGEPVFTREFVDELKKEVDRSLKLLEQGRQRD